MMIGLSIFLVLFFGASLYVLAPVLTPFVTGIVFAYLLAPIVEKLHKRGVSRSIASFTPVFIFFIALFALIAVVVPMLADDATRFINRLPNYIAWAEQTLNQKKHLLETLNHWGIHITAEELKEKLITYADQLAMMALSAAKNTAIGALALVDLVMLLVLTPLVMFYVLADWPKFTSSLNEMLPKTMKKQILETAAQINTKLNALVRGQFMVALSLGLFYGITLSISGLQMGFFIGLITGMLSIIPFMGFLVGLIIAFTVALLQYQFAEVTPYLILAAIFAVGQVLESFFLTPRMLGNKLGLHPVWVIFALLAGGHILGILGMLIALPIAIVVQVLLPLVFKKWCKKVDEELDDSK